MANKKVYYLLAASVLLVSLIGISYIWSNIAVPKKSKIAFVSLSDVDNATASAFKQELSTAGLQHGMDFIYLDAKPAGSIERLDDIIIKHLQNEPDLILVSSTPGTQAVKRLTRDKNIPVVFAPVNDPLAANIVSDLQQPDGNITGIRLPTGDDLRLQFLKKTNPEIKRVLVPFTSGDKSSSISVEIIQKKALILGFQLILEPVSSLENLKAVFAEHNDNIDAVFLPRDSSIESMIQHFVDYSIKLKIPLIAPSYVQVKKGALLSYGFVHEEIGKQAAHLAIQALRGREIKDLPVEMAENLLSVNMLTASKIGLNLPDSILYQADLIIRE